MKPIKVGHVTLSGDKKRGLFLTINDGITDYRWAIEESELWDIEQVIRHYKGYNEPSATDTQVIKYLKQYGTCKRPYNKDCAGCWATQLAGLIKFINS